MKISKIFLMLLLSMFLIQCTDEVSPTKHSIPSQYLYSGNYYTYDDLINQYNNGNLTGVIQLIKTKRNDVVVTEENGQRIENLFDGYVTRAHGGMFNSDYSPLNVISIVINATSLKQYAPGAYEDADPYSDIDIYFGSTPNKILIDSIDTFPFVKDSIYFPSEILITNVSRFDTVKKSNDFDITWTGGDNNSFIELDFSKNCTFWDTLTTDKFTGVSQIIDNVGSYTLPYRLLQNTLQLNGKYDLSVTAYTPKYITLSNGKQILFIGVSRHTVTVEVVD